MRNARKEGISTGRIHFILSLLLAVLGIAWMAASEVEEEKMEDFVEEVFIQEVPEDL